MTEKHHHLRVRCKKCTGRIFECPCPADVKLERWEPTCKTCIEIDEPRAALAVGVNRGR